MTELVEHFGLGGVDWSSAEDRKPLEEESAKLWEGSTAPLGVRMPEGVPERDVPYGGGGIPDVLEGVWDLITDGVFLPESGRPVGVGVL